MASKKSSAVPKRPTAATLAPSDSRYFGRNFFQSSSPNPSKNTAPDAAVTFRSRPRNSASRLWVVASRNSSPRGDSFFSQNFRPHPERLRPVPKPHHLLAILVQRFIDNPLCRIDFVVVANPQMPETLCDRLQSRSLGL